jgi:hypothetical protein
VVILCNLLLILYVGEIKINSFYLQSAGYWLYCDKGLQASPQLLYEVDVVISSILQLMTLRFEDKRWFAEGHTADSWQRLDLPLPYPLSTTAFSDWKLHIPALTYLKLSPNTWKRMGVGGLSFLTITFFCRATIFGLLVYTV